MLSLQWVFVQKLHKDIQYNPNPEPLTSLLSSDWDWIWLTGKTYGEWGQWTTQELQEQWRKPSALSCIDLLHTQKPQFMKPEPEPTSTYIFWVWVSSAVRAQNLNQIAPEECLRLASQDQKRTTDNVRKKDAHAIIPAIATHRSFHLRNLCRNSMCKLTNIQTALRGFNLGKVYNFNLGTCSKRSGSWTWWGRYRI